jgi:hypothetical protein
VQKTQFQEAIHITLSLERGACQPKPPFIG